ncbi:MAG TPA: DNA-directed RNA polymerase subunit K [Candidatus Norongarragalinales archaeon]|nr:DNA-directed RNA polymerase subunit K [Candidatus Norongarragalinales archaeon]
MTKHPHIEFTKYEKARIIGARALQLAMGAPCLVKTPKGMFNAVKLALFELEKDALPLQVVRQTI